LAHTEFQTVRTTAYTDTEADHVEYGAHNALGGILHAAPAASYSARPAAPIQPRDEDAGGFQPPGQRDFATGAVSPPDPAPYQAPLPLACGSAAADWSRWPAGTVFRVLPTGQVYRVDDYGWALSGRNTIDLYEPDRASMNAWGLRRVPIQILAWGDRDESLRILRGRQKFRHLRRMVLELEGRTRAAAELE
jgi:hypothetical protein